MRRASQADRAGRPRRYCRKHQLRLAYFAGRGRTVNELRRSRSDLPNCSYESITCLDIGRGSGEIEPSVSLQRLTEPPFLARLNDFTLRGVTIGMLSGVSRPSDARFDDVDTPKHARIEPELKSRTRLLRSGQSHYQRRGPTGCGADRRPKDAQGLWRFLRGGYQCRAGSTPDG